MGSLLLSVVWWCTGIAAVLSLVAVLRPLRILRLPTRRRAIKVFGCAALTLLAIALIPASLTRVTTASTRLDELAPSYHYAEAHARHVNAPPDRVYAAIKATTAGEIALFRTFTWVRRFGQSQPDSILNPPEDVPIIDVATGSGFRLLADEAPARADAGGELVLVAVVVPRRVRAFMNFRVEPEGGGSRLTTETRVVGIDAAAIRGFTPYWRTILPGSWILRVTWLQAIARRAQP